MNRRQLIGATSTVLTVGIAGCSGGGGGGLTGPSTPEETGRAYLEAYFAGEYEEARKFTAGTKREEMSEQDVAETAAQEPEINEIIETKQESGNAVSSVVVTADSSLGETTQTIDLLMTQQDGEWKVTKSRSDFEGTSRPEAASAFDNNVEGPVDVAFEFFKLYTTGDEEAAKQYYSGDEEVIGPSITNIDRTILKSVSQSESSAEVVLQAQKVTGKFDYRLNLVETEDNWRVKSVQMLS